MVSDLQILCMCSLVPGETVALWDWHHWMIELLRLSLKIPLASWSGRKDWVHSGPLPKYRTQASGLKSSNFRVPWKATCYCFRRCPWTRVEHGYHGCFRFTASAT